MSTQKIPNSEKQIIQSNIGDYRGNLYSTYNIDLDSNPGVIKPSKRLTRALDDSHADIATGDIMQALQIHDGNYYLATNADVLSCSVNNDPTVSANWNDVSTFNLEDLGLESDMTSFKGLLLVSLGTDIASWDGSTLNDDWWTTVASGTALTSSKVHTLEVLRTGNDTLFITDGNKVRYYNTTAAGTIITLDSLMTANCLTPTLDRMWVGTYTEVENNAYVYEIEVGNDQASQAYAVDGRVCLTMFTYNNTPFVITEKGYVQAFNGAGFVTVAQFPWADQSKVMNGCRPGLVQDPSTSKAIHPKGSKVSGKYAFIYVDANDEFNDGSLLSSRAPSGVWVLDLETYSLTHRYALTDASTDYGSFKVQRSGPLLITNTPETRIMVAGEVNGTEGVWMEGTATPQGYFVTVRHEADSIADAFETFVVKADTLDTSDTIDINYKDSVLSSFPLEVQGVTWLNANQFNTSNALTNVVGDEETGYTINVISGLGAGNVCHITSIEGGNTKTVTVDTDFGVLNSTSDIYIDNFKKLATQYTTDDGEFKKIGSPQSSTFRQYQVVMNGDVTVREVISKSNSKQEL